MTMPVPTELPEELPATSEAIAKHRDEIGIIPMSFKIVTALVLLLLVFPIFVVVLMSLNAGNYLSFPPQGLSIRWIENFFATEALRSAFVFSFQVALATAILSTVLGIMVAVWLVNAIRAKRKAAALVAAILLTPVVLPGISVGFAVFLAAFNVGIRASFPLLVLTHVTVSLPFAVIVIAATLYQLDPALEHAARSLGVGPIGAFRKVILPLALPGMTAGFLFALIISFGQSGLSVFLLPPNESTLPLALYFYLRFQFDPTPAAAGTFSILLVVVTTLVLNWLTPVGRLSARAK